MASSFGDFMLPIGRRGNFMKDDFFQGFQSDFDSAMKNVMSRFSGRTHLADKFANMRSQRAVSTQEDDSNTATISDNKDNYVIVLDVSEFLGGSIAVKTSGQYAVVEASFKTNSFNRKFLLPPNTNFDGVTSAMSDEGILTITAPKKGKTVEVTGEGSQPSISSDKGEPITNGSSASSNSEDKKLSISKKGKFFQDSFFENVLQDFETAMDEQVAKESSAKVQSSQQQKSTSTSESSSALNRPQFSRMNSYRNLREWAPITETQAVTITQDASGYKIVMDVKNFVGGPDRDINIKASEGACTVTGSRGPISFKRDFNLPGLKDPNQIEATVSEDGVLTIFAKI